MLLIFLINMHGLLLWAQKEGKYVFPERFIRTLKNKYINIWIQFQECVYWYIRWYSWWIQK